MYDFLVEGKSVWNYSLQAFETALLLLTFSKCFWLFKSGAFCTNCILWCWLNFYMPVPQSHQGFWNHWSYYAVTQMKLQCERKTLEVEAEHVCWKVVCERWQKIMSVDSRVRSASWRGRGADWKVRQKTACRRYIVVTWIRCCNKVFTCKLAVFPSICIIELILSIQYLLLFLLVTEQQREVILPCFVNKVWFEYR